MRQNVEKVNLTFICRLWFYRSSWPLTQDKLLNNDQSVDEDEGNYNEVKKEGLNELLLNIEVLSYLTFVSSLNKP